MGWDFTCPRPRGGNRHWKEIEDFNRALANCWAIYNSKCLSEPPPPPDPKSLLLMLLIMMMSTVCAGVPVGV